MLNRVTFKEIKVATTGQTEGRLVFHDEALVAVITRLDDTNEELRGRWFADASFDGLENMQDQTFATLPDVAQWVLDQLE